MAYSDEQLSKIYGKTDGNCHLCHKKLSFSNYGIHGARGGWHVEHSKARANGGSNHMNNLFPACIQCNLDKGTYHTKTARGWHGKTRAPHSSSKKKSIQTRNTVGGALLGGIIGSFLGPEGTIIGATIGGTIGRKTSPKK